MTEIQTTGSTKTATLTDGLECLVHNGKTEITRSTIGVTVTPATNTMMAGTRAELDAYIVANGITTPTIGRRRT